MSPASAAEFFAQQLERVLQTLKSAQPHARGPRKPTLAEQENSKK